MGSASRLGWGVRLAGLGSAGCAGGERAVGAMLHSRENRQSSRHLVERVMCSCVAARLSPTEPLRAQGGYRVRCSDGTWCQGSKHGSNPCKGDKPKGQCPDGDECCIDKVRAAVLFYAAAACAAGCAVIGGGCQGATLSRQLTRPPPATLPPTHRTAVHLLLGRQPLLLQGRPRVRKLGALRLVRGHARRTLGGRQRLRPACHFTFSQPLLTPRPCSDIPRCAGVPGCAHSPSCAHMPCHAPLPAGPPRTPATGTPRPPAAGMTATGGPPPGGAPWWVGGALTQFLWVAM